LTKNSGGSGLEINVAAAYGAFTLALATYAGVTKTDTFVRSAHSIDFRQTI